MIIELTTTTTGNGGSTGDIDTDSKAEDSENVKLYIFGIFLITICFIGLISNTLTIIIVLYRKEMNGSIKWLIAGLLLCDSSYLICSLALDGFPAILDYVIGRDIYLPENSFALEAAAQTGSIYFTIAISVERFIVVIYPLKARVLCTHFNSKLACLFVFTFSVILGLTYYCLYRRSYFVAGDIVLVGFQFIIPISLLAYLNLRIYHEVSKANVERGNMCPRCQHQPNSTDLSITKMLLAVVLVFAITYIPLLVEFIFYHCNNVRRVLVEDADNIEIMYTNTAWEYIPIIARLSVSLNCSVNFIIYCVAGTKFRKTVVKICTQIFCSEFCKNSSNAVRSSFRALVNFSEK